MPSKKTGNLSLTFVLLLTFFASLPITKGWSQSPAKSSWPALSLQEMEYLYSQVDSILNSGQARDSLRVAYATFLYSFHPDLSDEERSERLKTSLGISEQLFSGKPEVIYKTLMVRAQISLLPHLQLEEASRLIDMLKRDLESLVQAHPLNPELNSSYAELLLSLNRYSGFEHFLSRYFFTPLPEGDFNETALLHLLRARYLKPSPYVFYLLSQAYFKVGNHRDALLSIKQATSLQPETPYIDAYFQKLAKADKQSFVKRKDP